MMATHHFIPASILSLFGCFDAWKLVEAKQEIRMKIKNIDKSAIQNGLKRKFPLCVYDKRSRRLARRIVDKVCCKVNLYKIPDYREKLTRAIVRLNLNLKFYENQDIDLEHFMKLGEDPLDSELIEKNYIGNIDNEFGRIIPALINGDELSDNQISTLLQFVAFSRFRTPQWKTHYFPEMHQRVIAPLKQKIIALCQNAKQYEDRWGFSFAEIEEIIDEHFYHMALVEYSRKTENMLSYMTDPKMIIVHSKNRSLFIACDNPARPFNPKRLDSMAFDPLPGFIDPDVQMVYPISPFCCIQVSSNPHWPNFDHREIKYHQIIEINQALAIAAITEIIFPGLETSLYFNELNLENLCEIHRP
jgi:hypothetical protein